MCCHGYYRVCILRLDTPLSVPNPFDWSQDLNDIHHVHIKSIPSVHYSVLHIISHWMELYPDDFRYHPLLQVRQVCMTVVQVCVSQDYVGDIIHRLKKSGESYRLNTPHHRLKSLLQDLQVYHCILYHCTVFSPRDM